MSSTSTIAFMDKDNFKYFVIADDGIIKEFGTSKECEKYVKTVIECDPRVIYGRELQVGIRLGKEE